MENTGFLHEEYRTSLFKTQDLFIKNAGLLYSKYKACSFNIQGLFIKNAELLYSEYRMLIFFFKHFALFFIFLKSHFSIAWREKQAMHFLRLLKEKKQDSRCFLHKKKASKLSAHNAFFYGSKDVSFPAKGESFCRARRFPSFSLANREEQAGVCGKTSGHWRQNAKCFSRNALMFS